MGKKVLSVGIVGCGEIAQTVHIPILLEMENYKVVALCDVSKKIRTTLAERYGINNVYEEYQELVKQNDIDVVLVTNRDHAPVAIAAMNEGKHVLTEKPMAYNLEEADAMIDAAKRNNVKLMVGYMKRFDPAFEYALEEIRNIKKPQLIRMHDFAADFSINHEIYDQVYADDLDDSLKEKAFQNERVKMQKAIGESHASYIDAYSNLLYLLIHDLILVNSTFGLPDKVLFTEIYNQSSIISVMKYGEHMRCVLEGGLVLDRRDWDEHFVVFGDNKRVEIDFPFPYAKNLPSIVRVNEQDGKANMEKEVVTSYDEAFKQEWQHFYECIIKDQEPITNGVNSRREIELIISIIKAAPVKTN